MEHRPALKPMEDPAQTRVDTQRSPGPRKKPMLELVLGSTHESMESPFWNRFASRSCDPVGDPTLELSVLGGLHPVQGIYVGAGCELGLPGRPHTGEVHGELSAVGEIPCWSRGGL